MATEETTAKTAPKATMKAAPKAPVKEVEKEEVQQEVKKPTLAELVAHSRKTFKQAKEMKEKAELDAIAEKLK